LQYIEHFAGPIENVKSSLIYSGSNARKREVGINMALTFKNDVSGQAHIFCNSPNFMRHQLVFQCERGTIVLENKNSVVDAFTITLYGENGAKVLRTKSDKGRKNEDERVKIVRKLAERFVTACARKQQMTPSFYEGARVQELIDKIRAEKIR
jgi:predicted dehydrogenase